MKTIKLITSVNDLTNTMHKTTFDVYELDDITTTMREDLFNRDDTTEWYRDSVVEDIRELNIPWHLNRFPDLEVERFKYYCLTLSDDAGAIWHDYIAVPNYIDIAIKSYSSSIDIFLYEPFITCRDKLFSFVRTNYYEFTPEEAVKMALEYIYEYTDPIPNEFTEKIKDALETLFDALPKRNVEINQLDRNKSRR